MANMSSHRYKALSKEVEDLKSSLKAMQNLLQVRQKELAEASIHPKDLTYKVLSGLLGGYLGRVVIYDHINLELWPQKCGGYPIQYGNSELRDAAIAKEYFDSKLPNLKVIYTLGMLVAEEDFPGLGIWTPSGKILNAYDGEDGNTCSVCNYVVRNEKTKRYELLHNSWLGVEDNWKEREAAHLIFHDMTYPGAHYTSYREAVVQARAEHTR